MLSVDLDRGKSAAVLSEQRHLDAEAPERAYWHAGYRTALIDALRLLQDSSESHHSGDSAEGFPLAAPDGRSFH